MFADSAHYGEIMAVIAAMIFSWTSIFFTNASQRLGVTVVNLVRLPAGVLCLAASHYVLTGRLWPEYLPHSSQLWIGVSGVVGLAIGDSALFRAFVRVGPRRSMTTMASAPVFTIIAAWVLLGEQLDVRALVGIVVIIAGVMVATLGRDDGGGQFQNLPRRTLRTGLFLAVIGAAGQGFGSAFARLGMVGSQAASTAESATITGVDPLGATLVRMVWAAIAYWIVVLPRQNLQVIGHRLRDRRGVFSLVVAIICGPFISVWISLVALKHAEAGIAQVLLGLTPIFVIVPSWLVYRDRPAPLSLVGVVLALGGGALLFLR